MVLVRSLQCMLYCGWLHLTCLPVAKVSTLSHVNSSKCTSNVSFYKHADKNPEKKTDQGLNSLQHGCSGRYNATMCRCTTRLDNNQIHLLQREQRSHCYASRPRHSHKQRYFHKTKWRQNDRYGVQPLWNRSPNLQK